jgi:hypothetical protein
MSWRNGWRGFEEVFASSVLLHFMEFGIWNLFISLLSDSGEIDGEVAGKGVWWLLVYVLEGMNVVGGLAKRAGMYLLFS